MLRKPAGAAMPRPTRAILGPSTRTVPFSTTAPRPSNTVAPVNASFSCAVAGKAKQDDSRRSAAPLYRSPLSISKEQLQPELDLARVVRRRGRESEAGRRRRQVDVARWDREIRVV